MSDKSLFRRKLTIFLVAAVTVGLLILSGLTLYGVAITQLVIAYGTFTTFAAAIIATNLATKPGDSNELNE